MAYFESAVITSAGLNLMANDLAGVGDIEFVKMVSGSGEYTEEEKSRTALMGRTELKEQKQEFDINTIEVMSEKSVLLKSVISNKDLEEGYRITEIGVYAREKGTEGDGILYSISLAIEYDFLPPYNGLNPAEIVQEYYATVSNAENVTIVAKTGAYALSEDLEELKERISIGNSDEYDSSATYAVDDYCIHEKSLYRCVVAIETPEEWTPEHWEKTTIMKELQFLQNKEVEVVDPMTTTEEGFAADAKLTGDALRDLSANFHNALNRLRDTIKSIGGEIPDEFTLDDILSYIESKGLIKSDSSSILAAGPAGQQQITKSGYNYSLTQKSIDGNAFYMDNGAVVCRYDCTINYVLSGQTASCINVPCYVYLRKNGSNVNSISFVSGVSGQVQWSGVLSKSGTIACKANDRLSLYGYMNADGYLFAQNVKLSLSTNK